MSRLKRLYITDWDGKVIMNDD